MNSLAGSIPARPRFREFTTGTYTFYFVLLTTTIIISALPQTISALHLDPLEQFDVLSVSLPVVGSFGLTNLSLLLAFNLALITV